MKLQKKVLIADDDAGMRLVLRKLVEKAEGFQVVGEAADGPETLQLAESLRPQVVFLDVDMPVLNGVEVARQIADMDPKILLIFATAHEEYMSEAFSVYAFDYLVKPFKVERIRQTLKRVIALEQDRETVDIGNGLRHGKGLGKLMIRNKEGVSLVDMEDIVLIQREDRSTVIYTLHDRYVTSEGLTELEERLDPTRFFRSHKSYIVNLSMIRKIQPYGRWTLLIKFKETDLDALLTSERYEAMQKLFQ